MLIHTTGIILKQIKYGESNAICHILTRDTGVESCIVSLSKKKKEQSSNLFQATCLIQFNFNNNALKKIHRIQQAEWTYIYKQTNYDIQRHCVAIFIVDVVYQSVSYPEKNVALFDFIQSTLILNDHVTTTQVKNIPLFFIFHFLKLLGHDISLDITKEIVSQHQFQHYNQKAIMESLEYLSEQANESFLNIEYSKQHRRECFDVVLWHFVYVLPNFKIPPSLSIIKEILY